MQRHLALGGHAFALRIPESDRSPAVWQCIRCYGVVPAYALRERSWSRYIDHHCPALRKMLLQMQRPRE